MKKDKSENVTTWTFKGPGAMKRFARSGFRVTTTKSVGYSADRDTPPPKEKVTTTEKFISFGKIASVTLKAIAALIIAAVALKLFFKARSGYKILKKGSKR